MISKPIKHFSKISNKIKGTQTDSSNEIISNLIIVIK